MQLFHRQTGTKSAEHLATQKAIQLQLPEGETVLEKPFPSIGRIADLVWIPPKIVFEVQCSPISLIEVQARNADYLEEGFEVIWVLHDKRFNRRILSSSEIFLRGRKTYFTNINRRGEGMVYDQTEKIFFNHRLFKGPPEPIVVKKLPFKKNILRFKRKKRSRLQEMQKTCHLFFLYLLRKVSSS